MWSDARRWPARLGCALLLMTQFVPTLVGVATSTNPALTINVQPMVCQSPCDVRVRVRIEPHPLNRSLVIQADGPMFQGEILQLDGEFEAITRDRWFRALTAGEYEVVVVLLRLPSAAHPKGEQVRKSSRLIVTGGLRD